MQIILFNSNITNPQDIKINCNDIIQYEDKNPNKESWHIWFKKNKDFQISKQYSKIINNSDKSITMTARQISSYNGNLIKLSENSYRFINTTEAERLQNLSDGYCDNVHTNHRYKALGNCWTVNIIVHIFKQMNL